MKKVIRLTESDLARIVKRVIKENEMNQDPCMSSMDDTSMDEYINWDIKTTNCEGSRFGGMSSMGVDEDEDGNIIAFIRYCDGDDEELEYLKRKARYQICKENRLPSEDETLNESDLDRILKRVIKENEEDTIRIPKKYDGVRMELGRVANPQDIIDMYNELVEEGTPLVDYSEGMFYNEDDEEIPTDVILDELNYAIVGEEEDYDDEEEDF